MTRYLISTAIALSAMAFSPVLLSQPAEARPSTKSFTCEGVKDFVRRNRAVVMNHKAPHLYRRFVSSRQQCYNHDDRLARFTVPTRSGRCSLRICAPNFRNSN